MLNFVPSFVPSPHKPHIISTDNKVAENLVVRYIYFLNLKY